MRPLELGLDLAMALALAKAAPLNPEIKVAQALSEFEAVLVDDQKKRATHVPAIVAKSD